MKKTFCVAIDGPASSGKSTVAKSVAKELGFFHIDSGAIYRSLAWWMERQVEPLSNLDAFAYHIIEKEGKLAHYVGDKDVTLEIRAPYISQKSSEIATLSPVRIRVNELQRELACGRSVVIEGRDIGTVVFPNAQLKVFLTASVPERARRRFEELRLKGSLSTFDEVREDLVSRDERDKTREDAPLIQANDAILIDTSNMTPPEVIEKIVTLAKIKRAGPFWKFLLGEKRAVAQFTYKLVVLVTYAVYRVLYRFEVVGLENYPEGSAIIAPNHSSFLDPPAMGIACPQEVHCLAKSYLFKNPILNWILRRINTHPVMGDGSDLGVLKKIAEFLNQGKQVIIFPEGSRSHDNQVAPLKRGIALLASMTRCKVVPVKITGAYEAWPRSRKFPKLYGKIKVTFGVPLDWKDYEEKSSNKKDMQILFTRDLEEALINLGVK